MGVLATDMFNLLAQNFSLGGFPCYLSLKGCPSPSNDNGLSDWMLVNGFKGHVDPDTSPQFTIHCCESIRPRVFRASMGPSGRQPTTPVVIKVARTETELSFLQWEGKVYNQHLRALQGTVVPKCYGLFVTNNGGRRMGCLVLEHCAITNIRHADYRFVSWHYYEQLPSLKLSSSCKIMIAMSKIHQAGNVKPSSHILTTPDGIRIVDFASAALHECPNAMPRLVDTRDAFARQAGQCKELAVLEYTYGLADGRHIDEMLQASNSLSPPPVAHIHSHQKKYAELSRSHRPTRF
ncbi:uncharacterized protein EV420DRAFT_1514545 [Desarmillaria tabescens]|uniref:Uncharacterized protein n=1 Tax=Armillaria tabescens TaxID=1929756 RepID=A0AA39TNW2_ARMTA|nr:uncharacterized protein EV420DRAFT_1514545 [Desarmillaria tabescens]KAK0465477.1 hypothetical protein EV420DRAFT_1514545 [Desarmillaria tabescens]